MEHRRKTDVAFAAPNAFNPSDKGDFTVEGELQRVFSGCFGYTLIGEKPVSIEYCGGLEFCLNPEYQKLFFLHLEGLFNHSERFLLKNIRCANFYSEIILIDKPALANLIKKNPYLSNFVKKQYGSMENFFHSLEDPKQHIVDCFRRDNIAVGIVLGYGEGNGRYYQRYLDVGHYLKKYPVVCLLSFDPKPMPGMASESIQREINDVPYVPFVPEPSTEFASLEEEWDWMRKVRNKDYDETEIPYLFQLPFFISKKGPETDAIRKKYSKARDKIAKMFRGKEFSEKISERVAKN